MAIDTQSLFNPGSLQQMGETEDEKKKRAQITGTMMLGSQSGTFNGNFDPSLFQQQTNTSAPAAGYQLPPNYSMSAPPGQPPVPVIQPPAPTPPVGSDPISGEYAVPPPQPVTLPPGNQPYQPTPPEQQRDDRPPAQMFYPYQPNPPEQPPAAGGSFQGPPASSSTTQWRQNAAGEWESYNPQAFQTPQAPGQQPPPDNSLQVSDLGGGWGRGSDGKTYERNYINGGWDYSPTNDFGIGISNGQPGNFTPYGPPDQQPPELPPETFLAPPSALRGGPVLGNPPQQQPLPTPEPFDQYPGLQPSALLDWYSYQDDQGRTVYNNGTVSPVSPSDFMAF
jgi:hypothetical protein